jgi:uncharacterized protein (DUF111 family)
MKIAYVDAFSGISGDMFLAALLDAGLPLETLQEQLAMLNLPERVQVRVEETHKGAMRAALVTVEAPESHHHRHLEDIQAMINGSRLPKRCSELPWGCFRWWLKLKRTCMALRWKRCTSMRSARWTQSRIL